LESLTVKSGGMMSAASASPVRTFSSACSRLSTAIRSTALKSSSV